VFATSASASDSAMSIVFFTAASLL